MDFVRCSLDWPSVQRRVEFARVGKPVGCGLCILTTWRQEPTVGFIGSC